MTEAQQLFFAQGPLSNPAMCRPILYIIIFTLSKHNSYSYSTNNALNQVTVAI